jgi:hypothetical protein
MASGNRTALKLAKKWEQRMERGKQVGSDGFCQSVALRLSNKILLGCTLHAQQISFETSLKHMHTLSRPISLSLSLSLSLPLPLSLSHTHTHTHTHTFQVPCKASLGKHTSLHPPYIINLLIPFMLPYSHRSLLTMLCLGRRGPRSALLMRAMAQHTWPG